MQGKPQKNRLSIFEEHAVCAISSSKKASNLRKQDAIFAFFIG
jgi:hypothetical protein